MRPDSVFAQRTAGESALLANDCASILKVEVADTDVHLHCSCQLLPSGGRSDREGATSPRYARVWRVLTLQAYLDPDGERIESGGGIRSSPGHTFLVSVLGRRESAHALEPVHQLLLLFIGFEELASSAGVDSGVCKVRSPKGGSGVRTNGLCEGLSQSRISKAVGVGGKVSGLLQHAAIRRCGCCERS